MKTESAVFGTRQQLDQVCIDSIKVDATSIQPWRPMSTRFALKLIMVSAKSGSFFLKRPQGRLSMPSSYLILIIAMRFFLASLASSWNKFNVCSMPLPELFSCPKVWPYFTCPCSSALASSAVSCSVQNLALGFQVSDQGGSGQNTSDTWFSLRRLAVLALGLSLEFFWRFLESDAQHVDRSTKSFLLHCPPHILGSDAANIRFPSLQRTPRYNELIPWIQRPGGSLYRGIVISEPIKEVCPGTENLTKVATIETSPIKLIEIHSFRFYAWENEKVRHSAQIDEIECAWYKNNLYDKKIASLPL